MTAEDDRTGNVTDMFEAAGFVPVAVIDRPDDAIRAADALARGGLAVMEITCRTDAAISSIEAVAGERPGILVGAGTVTSLPQAEAVVGAGARFIVSPGFDQGLVEWCVAEDVPVFPGVATPTEAQAAVRSGVGVVKFFPAELMGGVAMIRAFGSVYGDLRFMPTGGINTQILPTYLNESSVIACGGTWVVERNLVRERRFSEVEERARQVVELVSATRAGHQPPVVR